ncbi:hypothetical protein XBFFL1_2050001 [Xenorhabdus bovienii str. feltiae Florida]|nr:hypothetical protein XBFFR1_860001 [Xenorhabdus bovienii str. feltiae France]CDG92242.1 hypothetical protein XBFFL1_2050001 [Xenorhabdus bovienii str. feltiae Florida]
MKIYKHRGSYYGKISADYIIFSGYGCIKFKVEYHLFYYQ